MNKEKQKQEEQEKEINTTLSIKVSVESKIKIERVCEANDLSIRQLINHLIDELDENAVFKKVLKRV